MNSELRTAHEDAIRAVKKQRLCEESTRNSIDALITQFQSTLDRIRNGEVQSIQEELRQLQEYIEQAELLKKMNKDTRELHASISKLGKVMENYFLPDVSIATRDIKMDPESLRRVLWEHLLKDGRFELCDIFEKEAGIPEPKELKESYMKLHSIVQDLKRRDLDSALKWAIENRLKINPNGKPSRFEFQLHRLRFLTILKLEGQMKALEYCRLNFHQFADDYFPEIQRLTARLVFVKQQVSQSPYQDDHDQQWEDIIHEFIKEASEILGQAYQSPLLVTVSAGSIVLPQLSRLADVMVSSGQDIKQCTQLPLEVEVGREFQFHSIFACPVSKDQSTQENPPMMISCGHVLCEHSIAKIAKQKPKHFKCPYCPMEAALENCKKLVFPDVIQ
eukprot:g4721.t1